MAEDVSRFRDERANAQIAASHLRTTPEVRTRCARLLAGVRTTGSRWFEIDDKALQVAARDLASVLQRQFPRLHVPLHSVWRLFGQDGVDRQGHLEQLLLTQPPTHRTHARLDLAAVVVLLCTAADDCEPYTEPATGHRFAGATGRAVATLHAFTAGLFSSDPQRPFQADARGLRGIVTDRLAAALQVHDRAGLRELGRRAILLRRLGELLSEQPEVFGEEGRPAGIFDIIVSPYGHGVAHTADVDAHDILSQLLTTLSGLWPGGGEIGGTLLGDCWRHRLAQGDGLSEGWVPLHATLQALARSFLEPFLRAGVQVRGIGGLTATADRHVCQWVLDTGALRLRDPQAAGARWTCADEIVVEWRALSLALLEEIASRVRELLTRDEQGLPMGCILEGVAYAAGTDRGLPAPPAQAALQVTADPALF